MTDQPASPRDNADLLPAILRIERDLRDHGFLGMDKATTLIDIAKRLAARDAAHRHAEYHGGEG